VKLLRAGSAKKRSNLKDEATFPGFAVIPKRTIALIAPTNKRGCDHVAAHSQRDLQAVPFGRSFRHFKSGSKAMMEIMTALAVFFSISVFLAHAFDVYRTN
jgi:hypothetical protein